MGAILYCEDDRNNREVIDSALRANFPAQNIISAETVRGGLERITGVSLTREELGKISLETVEQRLRSFGANLSGLGMVITDGELIDPVAGAGDEILHGWDLAQILRNLGYTGRVVYTGMQSIPIGKGYLFNVKISKWEERLIVDYIRANLE